MFNFFDFILSSIGGGELGILLRIAKVLSKGGKGVRSAINKAAADTLKNPKNIKGFIQQMLKDPKSLANGLSKMSPQELEKLNSAIDKARDKTLKVKKTITGVSESKALSST